MKTLLALGAHYDDCVFGIPGILLQGVRKHYRVVVLSLIGDYTNWAPAKGRSAEFVEGARRLAQERGVEMRFLNFASHRFDARLENKLLVARAVADIKPDVAFTLWKDDHHNDHVVASELTRVAVRNAGQMLEGVSYQPPGRLYFYDNGPRHTIGFTPDTFVDVSDTWTEAQDWLGALMALKDNRPYDRTKPDGAQQAKETLARYRGASCGAKYAEALWLGLPRVAEIL
ncbi:hypothetical protein LBMAG56_38870 [Verrucomicrobiota bacterium]|nr:hypothetical protein LBMAG56_38870 [Verrucomicrobiota bacterium]